MFLFFFLCLLNTAVTFFIAYLLISHVFTSCKLRRNKIKLKVEKYVCVCVCSNSSLNSLSQLKTKFTWDHHGIGEKVYSNDSGQLLFFILILSAPPPGEGAFSGDFTTNLARQCRAFSRALKIEKLKAPLFRGPEGPGLQMTGA